MTEENLSPIEWMDVLETGVAEIDDDHRSLIEHCNALGVLIENGSWKEVVAEARRLAELCSEHFRTEEVLLDRTEFPRADKHKRTHHEIERRFKELVGFLAGADGTKPDHRKAARSVRTTLVDILFRHDLDYKSHLQQVSGR